MRRYDGLFVRNFTTKLGISITLDSSGVDPPASHTGAFWPYFGLEQCSSGLLFEMSESIKDEVMHLYPRPNTTGVGHPLVMHLRGGDAVRFACKSPWYGQPVCSFYLGAMARDREHDRVVIVAEDSANPCLQLCLDQGAVWNPATLADDLAHMLWASRFVLSRSTLMFAVMYLSPVKKHWYLYGGLNIKDPSLDPVWHVYAPIGPHWNCLPSAETQIDLIRDWRPWKFRRLLTENCTWFWADEKWFDPLFITARTEAMWANPSSR
jgi:hypothetical protein